MLISLRKLLQQQTDSSGLKCFSAQRKKRPEGRFFLQFMNFNEAHKPNFGAGNETRTRDPDLGKVVLYQLSYSRILVKVAIL